jgi:hypothetical protein
MKENILGSDSVEFHIEGQEGVLRINERPPRLREFPAAKASDAYLTNA